MKKYVIEKLRKQKGLSQQELSDKLGVTVKEVDRWENTTVEQDDCQGISDENSKKLEELFGCDEESLYNNDLSEWVDVAANDGEQAKQSIPEKDKHKIISFKEKTLSALQGHDKDRATELLTEFMVAYNLKFNFMVQFLKEKNESSYKKLCLAFLSKL